VTGPEYEGNNVYDHLFSGELQTELSCVENPDENSTTTEPFWKLACYMDKEVTFVLNGVMKGMEGGLEKMSATLGVQANYSKISRISKLPRYLVISFNRFDSKTVKQTGPGDSDKVVGLKIMKPVSFPFVLDVYQLCSSDLKAVLDVDRHRLEEIKEAELAAKQSSGTLLEQRACDLSPGAREAELERLKNEKMGAAAEGEDQMAMEVDAAAGEATQAMQVDGTEDEKKVLGYYDLCGVITHKGRALSSGHYQGWVKNPEAGWLQYDDDEVIPRKDEDIQKLSGGGDWDTAYLVIYKTRFSLP